MQTEGEEPTRKLIREEFYCLDVELEIHWRRRKPQLSSEGSSKSIDITKQITHDDHFDNRLSDSIEENFEDVNQVLGEGESAYGKLLSGVVNIETSSKSVNYNNDVQGAESSDTASFETSLSVGNKAGIDSIKFQIPESNRAFELSHPSFSSNMGSDDMSSEFSESHSDFSHSDRKQI